jgi:hypothetical protein
MQRLKPVEEERKPVAGDKNGLADMLRQIPGTEIPGRKKEDAKVTTNGLYESDNTTSLKHLHKRIIEVFRDHVTGAVGRPEPKRARQSIFQRIVPKATALAFCVGLTSAQYVASAQDTPTTGAYTWVYTQDGTTLTTSSINTSPSGSTILVWVGCGTSGDLSAVPTDNKGNTYVGLGMHTFAPNYSSDGEQMYVCTNAVGGTGHTFTFTVPPLPELQIVVVEIKNGGVLQDVKYNTVLSPNANTSLNVTATGPATIVALWAGDAGGANFTAVPNNSLTVIQSFLYLPNDYGFEYAEATKNVTAGTYNVTWTETPVEGAHLWLAVVQQTTQAPPQPPTDLRIESVSP